MCNVKYWNLVVSFRFKRYIWSKSKCTKRCFRFCFWYFWREKTVSEKKNWFFLLLNIRCVCGLGFLQYSLWGIHQNDFFAILQIVPLFMCINSQITNSQTSLQFGIFLFFLTHIQFVKNSFSQLFERLNELHSILLNKKSLSEYKIKKNN